eukprot:scaffold252104_cov36-Prasinocladus_malaysianus.AAC.1
MSRKTHSASDYPYGMSPVATGRDQLSTASSATTLYQKPIHDRLHAWLADCCYEYAAKELSFLPKSGVERHPAGSAKRPEHSEQTRRETTTSVFSGYF